jgi:hypothetical protein
MNLPLENLMPKTIYEKEKGININILNIESLK